VPDVGQAGQDQDNLARAVAQQLPQRGETVRARHEQVEDDEVVDLGTGPAEPVGGGFGQVDHEAFRGQGAAEGGPDRVLVVDDQDTRPGHGRRRRAHVAGNPLVGHGLATAPARAAPPWNTKPMLMVRIPHHQVQSFRYGITLD
jgi:hypothetical protein